MGETEKAGPSAEDIERGYEIKKWHEHDNFMCLKCQYSILWEDMMKKHQAAGFHFWSKPGKPGSQQSAPELSGRGPTY